MANKSVYIPNDDIQIYNPCRVQLIIEMFGHSTYLTNQ